MLRILFLAVIFSCVFTACTKKTETKPLLENPFGSLIVQDLKPFYHGVASGDPLKDRVIIWTRVTPDTQEDSVAVRWEVAADDRFEVIKSTGVFTTFPARDYTVKVDVGNLEPGNTYFYRFHAFEKTSPIGKTKTTPVAARDSLSFAVVSCSNWEFGYFNSYEAIAQQDVDAVLHLGDYIYEYGTGKYGDTTIGRINIPEHEIISLTDYRLRHGQYRLDKGLQRMSQQHAMIAIWDDHEVANDTYKDGAQNHQPEEGSFEDRKRAARQAYYEWMPIRESEKLYRSFYYGELAEVIMLDERLEGRTKQAENLSDPDLTNDVRSMLGEQQLQWFTEKLKTSTAQWKVIGNQVIFSGLDESFYENAKSTDNWNGYPVERKKIADFIVNNTINNVVFLTGDTHASWAFEVALSPKQYAAKKEIPFAVEFGTPSVSSGNWDERLTYDTAKLGEQLYLKFNPHLKYVNGVDHGYMLLTLHKDHATASWYYVETLREQNTNHTQKKSVAVKTTGNTLY